MGDSQNLDNDLLSRLNALKNSHVSLDTNEPLPVSQTEQTPESDLSARLKSLRAGARQSLTSSKPILQSQVSSDTLAYSSIAEWLGEDVESLLAELTAAPAEWETDEVMQYTDSRATQSLLDDARDVLARGRAWKKQEAQERDFDDTLSNTFASKSQNERQNESREVDEIVARLLDELELERNEDGGQVVEENGTNSRDPKLGNASPKLPAALGRTSPSGPDRKLSSDQQKTDLGFEDDMMARLAALRGVGAPSRPCVDSFKLPSAPTSAPGSAKPSSPTTSEATIDSECGVCGRNATLICHGCDGAVYCVKCWKEDHFPSDMSWQELGHKWTKFYKKP